MPLVQRSVCSFNYDLHGLNTRGIPARGGVSSVGRNEVVCKKYLNCSDEPFI